jgi:hypothetical protein
MSSGGGASTASTQPKKVLALQVSQSTYGVAIPRVWGRARVSGNLLGYYDFVGRQVEDATSSGGGKGGGGSAPKSYTWHYSAAMMIAVASGQITAVSRVWVDKATQTLGELGFALKTGALGQSPWSYLSTRHPAKAYSYSGIAYVAAESFDFGDEPSSPQLNFEVIGERATRPDQDAWPADIVTDIWTDPVEGLGLASGSMDLADYRAWCEANDFGLGLAADTQRAARDWLQMVLDATLAEAVPSQGKIRIVPVGDEPVGSWEPDTSYAYHVTQDDVLDEPIFSRDQPRTCKNKATVEYNDREKDFNTVPISESDIVHVNLYGENGETYSLPCITRADMAGLVAAFKKDRALYTLGSVELRLSEAFCLLEPADLLLVSFPALGLRALPLRVREITYSDEGELTVSCKEWPAGVGSPVVSDAQPTGGYVPNYNQAPGNANPPVILEPPVSLAGQPELWLATSGGQHWGGCEVWVSLDDATYSLAGTLTRAARHGLLTANYPLASDPDNANTLAVDISVSGGQLTPASAEARDLYQTLCWVGNAAGGELIAYQGATLTGVGRYNLTNCRRGAYGSQRSAHAVGRQFVRLDGAQFRYAYEPALIGKTLYIKLRSFNKFNAAMQDLADVSALAYVVKGAPLGAVAGLALESPFSGLTFAAKWNAYAGASYYTLELWSGGALRKSLSTKDTRFEATIQQLVSWGVARTVELRVVAVADSGQSTTPAVLIATKAQIAAPTVSVQDTSESMIVTASQSTDAAYRATRIAISQTNGFAPGGVAPYYDGPQTAYPSGKLAAGTWYVRVAQYDQFGPDALNWSSQIALAVSDAAQGVQRVANAASITAAPGSPPPGGKAFWAVFDNATGKIWRWSSAAGAYTKAADGGDLVAASVAADKIAVGALSAISAYLGTLIAGVIDFAGGAGWQYIRTASKWWNDGVNGWISATRPETSSHFQEFRASSGSALVLEQKGSGPDLGGLNYRLLVKGSDGVDRVDINPQSNWFKFRGHIEALSGSFAGTLQAATGSFAGTMTAEAVNAVSRINIGDEQITIARAVDGSSITWSPSSLAAGESVRCIVVASVSITGRAPWLTTATVTQGGEVRNLKAYAFGGTRGVATVYVDGIAIKSKGFFVRGCSLIETTIMVPVQIAKGAVVSVGFTGEQFTSDGDVASSSFSLVVPASASFMSACSIMIQGIAK